MSESGQEAGALAPTAARRAFWRGRAGRLAAWAAGLFAAYSLAGFFLVPPLAKYLIERFGSDKLQRVVSVGGIDFNPYRLSATLRDFAVRDAEGAGAALAFGELHADLEMQSLARGGWVLRELRLAAPTLRVVRRADGSLDFSDVLERLRQQPAGEPARFSVSNIQIEGGALEWDDRQLGRRHALTDLRIGLPVVSNLAADVDRFIEPAFEARLDGAPLHGLSRAKPFAAAPEANLDIELGALDLPEYLAYLPAKLPFALPAARLEAKLRVEFASAAEGASSLRISGTAALRDVELRTREGEPLVALPALDAQFERLEPLAGHYALARLTVSGARLNLLRDEAGVLNLATLFPDPAPASAKAAPAPRFSIGELRVADAAVQWEDRLPAGGFKTRVEAIELTARNLGNRPGAAADIEASARAGGGERLRHSGKLTLAPLAAEGRVEFEGLRPAAYAPYYRQRVRFAVMDGVLGAAAAYRYASGDAGPEFSLSDMQADLDRLALRREGAGEDFLRLAGLALRGGRLDLAKRQLAVAEIAATQGRLAIARARDGTLDLASLLAPAPPEAPAAPPWTLELKRLALTDWDLRFDDRSVASAVRAEAKPVSLVIEDISTRSDALLRFKLDAATGAKGRLGAAGSLRLQPLSARLDVKIDELGLLAFEPYLRERLNIVLAQGALSAAGKLELDLPPRGALKFAYRGEAALTDLRSTDAEGADFLIWKSLHLTGIEAGSAPPRFDTAEVALSDFYSRLVIQPDGVINLQQVLRAPQAQPPPEGAAPAGSGPAPAFSVGRVSLQGGKVDFSDRFIKPNYSADLSEIGGRVSRFSSLTAEPAELEVRGKVNGSAPLQITGRINPLADPLFLDLKAGVKDIELPPFTPYSAKYAGYAIEKGKLALDVAYRVEQGRLEGDNRLFLDQLTFGDPVESPDATKLPVLLAVALLKNARGEIDLKLPISGSLDDPEFSIGGVVGAMLANAVVKVVTAPFAVLGAIFGGGEDLSQVEFAPGGAVLTDEANQRLQALARALKDRPGLKLELSGRADAGRDAEALKLARLSQRVRAQMPEAERAAGQALRGEDYLRYLELAYRAADFPKPRNALGLTKSLPREEMETLMLTHIKVSEDDLHALAERRARVVRAWLTGEGGVAAERVFVVAPRLGADGAEDKAPASRVDFALR